MWIAPQVPKPTQWRAFSSSGSPGFVLLQDLGVYDTGYFTLTSTSIRRPSQASLSPRRRKTKRYWSSGLSDAGSPDAFDTSGPSVHVLISRLPRLSVSCQGPGSGFLILVARRLPSPVAVSKGCRRDKSVPHPGLVTFPGPARLGSQRGKDSGNEMACDPGVDLPCSQVMLPAGPMSHSGGRSRMAFSSLDKMEASSESQCPPNFLFQTKSYDVERGFCVMLGHPWKSL